MTRKDQNSRQKSKTEYLHQVTKFKASFHSRGSCCFALVSFFLLAEVGCFRVFGEFPLETNFPSIKAQMKESRDKRAGEREGEKEIQEGKAVHGSAKNGGSKEVSCRKDTETRERGAKKMR